MGVWSQPVQQLKLRALVYCKRGFAGTEIVACMTPLSLQLPDQEERRKEEEAALILADSFSPLLLSSQSIGRGIGQLRLGRGGLVCAGCSRAK